jgi:4-nitrophenyl phosphatase
MVYERDLKDIDNFVFDLDGTVWEWNRLKDGVKKTIEKLEKNDKTIKFFTNNAVLRRDQYAEKLRDLGINAEAADVLSASYIAGKVFDQEDIRDVFVIGEEGLRDELRANDVAHTEDADDVLIAVDRNFSYWKAATAADILRDGGNLWTTSVDNYWWAGDRQLPGTGSLTAAVKLAAGAADDPTIIGKPSDHAMDVLRDEWSLMPDNTIMVGDNLQSDIVFGNKLGYMTGLVLGGTSAPADLDEIDDGFEKPNVVFREFKRIIMKL